MDMNSLLHRFCTKIQKINNIWENKARHRKNLKTVM